jgi:hypothetical protein
MRRSDWLYVSKTAEQPAQESLETPIYLAYWLELLVQTPLMEMLQNRALTVDGALQLSRGPFLRGCFEQFINFGGNPRPLSGDIERIFVDLLPSFLVLRQIDCCFGQ